MFWMINFSYGTHLARYPTATLICPSSPRIQHTRPINSVVRLGSYEGVTHMRNRRVIY